MVPPNPARTGRLPDINLLDTMMQTTFLLLLVSLLPFSLWAQPTKIIFDTDMESDVDDVGALAMLHGLADAGDAGDDVVEVVDRALAVARGVDHEADDEDDHHAQADDGEVVGGRWEWIRTLIDRLPGPRWVGPVVVDLEAGDDLFERVAEIAVVARESVASQQHHRALVVLEAAATVRRGGFTLSVSGHLPVELLRLLAEAAEPAG